MLSLVLRARLSSAAWSDDNLDRVFRAVRRGCTFLGLDTHTIECDRHTDDDTDDCTRRRGRQLQTHATTQRCDTSSLFFMSTRRLGGAPLFSAGSPANQHSLSFCSHTHQSFSCVGMPRMDHSAHSVRNPRDTKHLPVGARACVFGNWKREERGCAVERTADIYSNDSRRHGE